jgi:hypothetical protein
VVFLGPRANAELVPKFHVALHPSHAALPMVTSKLHYNADLSTSYKNEFRSWAVKPRLNFISSGFAPFPFLEFHPSLKSTSTRRTSGPLPGNLQNRIEKEKIGGTHRQQGDLISLLLFFFK